MAERRRPRAPSSRFSGLLITNLVFSDKKLGRGADATVYEVDWNGTPCAAKRLHELLLEDDSPGGAERFISNFEAECVTWSKLRHPGVVQFLGVYLEHSSRLPVLIMEKMDISLRRYLKNHGKKEFPLNFKVFALRQISQALAYLHGQNPPLVHHDLSPNNVLLNEVSFVTKLTDFGMSRAIILSSSIRESSSVKGTPAFMSPEALQSPPQYNEKLDVFSFGNIILSILTHDWPEPGPPTRYDGDKIIGLTELQRRERYVVLFTAQEQQLFLPTVRQCLENRPDKRPSSAVLMQELRRIESSLWTGSHVTSPFEQVRQQLSAKEEECKQKDDALQVKDDTLRETYTTIKEQEDIIQEQQDIIQEQQDTIQEQAAEIQQLRSQLAVARQVKYPLRDWRKLGECQKVIQHSPAGSMYYAVAVSNEGLLAVTDETNMCVHILTNTGTLVRSIGKTLLDSGLLGVAFDLKGNIWVTHWSKNKVIKLSQDGQLLKTIRHTDSESDCLSHPTSVSVSAEGHIYICDSHRVTVYDEEGRFQLAFGSKGSGPGCFDRPGDVAFGSDGLVYVVDEGNKRVSVWSKEGTYTHDFQPVFDPYYIAAASDNHLLITSDSCHAIMVYTVEGKLIHQFTERDSDSGRLNRPWGICVDGSGLVYVVDWGNKRVLVY